jgi:hypothetical protein
MSQESDKVPETITFSRRKTIIYSLLPALLLLGGVEGCCRVVELWRPPLTLDYGWGFNEDSRVFVPAGIARNTMITRPEKLVSFQRQSFKMPKPKHVYRMVMLGGSNANYMYWPLRHMAERLSLSPGEKRIFETINMGGLAYGSHRLRIMMAEILEYNPDLLLIYAGHNEFEELKHQAITDLEHIAVQKAAYSLAMLRALRDIRASMDLFLRSRQAQNMDLPPEVDYRNVASHTFTQEEIEARMTLFRENMDVIVALCRERNVPVIISTVATNLWEPDLPLQFREEKEKIRGLYESGAYEEGMHLARETLAKSERHQASDVENNIIREIAAKHDLPLVEGEQLIMAAEPNGVPGETLLSDRCHITEEGREIVVAAFEQAIRNIVQTGQP